MTAINLDGNRLADDLKADMVTRIAALADRGITPGLGTILVGDDGPSAKYVGMKHRDCAEVGMTSVDRRLPADATQAEVESAIDELNADPTVDAFIVQYPFPWRCCADPAKTTAQRSTWACSSRAVGAGRLHLGHRACCTPTTCRSPASTW
jgi:methylenetetrahydrofolate dehydrogenase (NADP+)/methenyltetrahydrofolate cyclohydrolase